MTKLSRITFHRVHAPYQPGDTVGLPKPIADDLIARGFAVDDEAPLPAPVDFATMDRAELLTHAATVLGLTDAPPEDVSDDELRAALQAHADGMEVPPPPTGVDQLDALDREHLEAFAKTKLGVTGVDPAMSDDELRAKIRSLVDTMASNPETSPVGTATRKKRA